MTSFSHCHGREAGSGGRRSGRGLVGGLRPLVRAPASFECRRYVTLELGKSRQIILGEILFAHYHSDVVDADRMRIDPAKLDAIARLGGNTCSTIRDRFEMLTPTLEEYYAGLSRDPAI